MPIVRSDVAAFILFHYLGCAAFSAGVLTACGHLFCSTCLRSWLNRNQTCPTCKSRLRHGACQSGKLSESSSLKQATDLKEVVFEEHASANKEGQEKHDRTGAQQAIRAALGASASAAKVKSVSLSKMDEDGVSRIQDVPTQTGLGKKLDTVIKHVRLLQTDDPGCKIVRTLESLCFYREQQLIICPDQFVGDFGMKIKLCANLLLQSFCMEAILELM